MRSCRLHRVTHNHDVCRVFKHFFCYETFVVLLSVVYMPSFFVGKVLKISVINFN